MLPSSLRGEGWTASTARTMIPLLVWCATNEKKITYGQINAEIARRNLGDYGFPLAYRLPAGAIGDALIQTGNDLGRHIPPLNALVINAKTGCPGNGCDYYLTKYLKNKPRRGLNAEEKRTISECVMEEVWNYEGWQELLKIYKLKSITDDIPALSQSDTKPITPTRSGWSNEPDSEEHKALKEWVAKNPHVLQSKISFPKGKTEWTFSSSDKVDVMFEYRHGCIAVEVKSLRSNDADLERGIYQCVKYQALLRAELKAASKIPNGTSVLITERPLPEHLKQLAKLLSVKSILVQPVLNKK